MIEPSKAKATRTIKCSSDFNSLTNAQFQPPTSWYSGGDDFYDIIKVNETQV